MNTPTFGKRPSEPSVGESWAYRHRAYEPLVEVDVIRIGVKRPQRVLILFVDDDFEGRQEWVPPARLKALWRDVDAFKDWEGRWEAVVAASSEQDLAEESAASVVFDLLIDPEVASMGYNATAGVVKIRDVPVLAAYLELDPQDLAAHQASFEEEHRLVAPWPTEKQSVRCAWPAPRAIRAARAGTCRASRTRTRAWGADCAGSVAISSPCVQLIPCRMSAGKHGRFVDPSPTAVGS